MQVFQLRLICFLVLLAAAKHGIGLLKQLFLPFRDLILVYIKLLGKLCQYLVALNRCQCYLGFEPRQMVASFSSHLLLLWWFKLHQELHLRYCLESGVHFNLLQPIAGQAFGFSFDGHDFLLCWGQEKVLTGYCVN